MRLQIGFRNKSAGLAIKLRWASLARRVKDIDDARNIIAVQDPALDWAYVRHWCAAHGTVALLDEVRASIPPE